jgi:hypothetical protein
MDETAMASRPRALGEALRNARLLAACPGGLLDVVIISGLVSEPDER